MNAPAACVEANRLDTLSLPSVCIVGPLPPPSGGMANQCRELVRLLGEEGVQVELVRSNAAYRPAWVGRIPVLRALFRLLPYAVRLWGAAGRAEVLHVLANSGWAWHLFAAPAVWIGRLRGRAVIVNYHGGNAATFLARAPRIVLATLRQASALVTPSSYLQRVFAAHGLQATVVANVLDLTRFEPATRRPVERAPHLIVTRNLEAVYDIPTAIRAFAKIRVTFPEARLTVAGSGPELSRLQALVDELALSEAVTFSGAIDNAKIPALYATADCLLNPSTVDNLPVSILEAFASAVPVVSTDVGGIPDLVEDGVSAQLVPAGEPGRMADAAVRVLGNPDMAASMCAAGQRTVGAYAWPSVRTQWLREYRRVSARKEIE